MGGEVHVHVHVWYIEMLAGRGGRGRRGTCVGQVLVGRRCQCVDGGGCVCVCVCVCRTVYVYIYICETGGRVADWEGSVHCMVWVRGNGERGKGEEGGGEGGGGRRSVGVWMDGGVKEAVEMLADKVVCVHCMVRRKLGMGDGGGRGRGRSGGDRGRRRSDGGGGGEGGGTLEGRKEDKNLRNIIGRWKKMHA